MELRFAERCDRLMLSHSFFRGLSEVHGRVDQAGLDGPHEIGRIDAVHGGADGVDLKQVAYHDLCTRLSQGFGPRILVVDYRADLKPKGD